MKKNIGNIDRVIRFAVAVLIAILHFSGVISGTIGLILVILAVVFALTSLISFCPIYWAIGLSTKSDENPKSADSKK